MSDLTPLGQVFDCRHSDAVLSQVPQTAGRARIVMWCRSCRRIVSKEKGFPGLWIARDHPELAGKDLDALPVAYDLRTYRRCEGPCRQLALCELHHLAPRAFFGDEADEWPTAWLCRPCHDRWHALVTPGLATPHDPAAHAALLLDYLGLDRAARLARALVDAGKARRAGAA